jgi:hypothetical protein
MKNLRPQDIKIGDSVKVKKGKCHYCVTNYDIGGFEGRVFTKYKEDNVWSIEIEFDSITLKSMSLKYIRDNIKNVVDYACLDFQIQDVEKSKVRDTVKDVKAARKVIEKKTNFKSILDEKEYDVWKKPAKTVKEPKPKPGEMTAHISMALFRGFLLQWEKVKEMKRIALEEAAKIDPNEKIDMSDFIKWVFLPETIKKAFLGGRDKKMPFRYVEDITKEKFLSIKNLKEIDWYAFLFCITQNIYYTKYHDTVQRLYDYFKIDFVELMKNLMPGVEIKSPKTKLSGPPVIAKINFIK